MHCEARVETGIMRQIVLDTETTGLEPREGHRIIEIGCVELVDRKLTGKTYHQYINPERIVDEGAIEIHGITNEYLEDKPLFVDIYDDFLQFVRGSELIIHNAPFDVGFINHEFTLLNNNITIIEDYCSVLDSLAMARDLHPGQRNTLDALCKRYVVDNSNRDLHGALLDSEILSDVYLAMTGGQTRLILEDSATSAGGVEKIRRLSEKQGRAFVYHASEEELAVHKEYLNMLEKSCGREVLWRKI
jgi:DNA polymerase-3 subunit epsilon